MKTVILHSIPIHYKHWLFRSLKALGLDFEVLFLSTGSTTVHEKIPLHPDTYKFRIGFNGMYQSAPARTRARFTWSSLSEIDPDIVIVSGYHVTESWVALLWSRLHRKRLVMWFDGNKWDYPRHWYKELPKKVFLSQCDQAQVYGKSSSEYMLALGVKPSHIIRKRTVANVDVFSTRDDQKGYFADGTRRLIFVGRLSPEKNVGTLLRSLARANSSANGSPLYLTIAGVGPLEGELKAECERLGLNKVVTFEGYCPQNDLPKLMRKADFFVLPSSREPYGLVTIEAMLCRLPVIVSTQCGCTADVVNPETGWSFSAWNESELAEILKGLSTISADRARKMGEAAFRVASDFNADASAMLVLNGLKALSSPTDFDNRAQTTATLSS